jgi:hypothetical protein
MNAPHHSFISNLAVMSDLDRIGQLKAEIADLKKEQDLLIDVFKNAGEGKYEGKLFKASVYMSSTDRVDYKAVALAALERVAKHMDEKEYADFSTGLISANTEQTVSIGFRLSAR